MKLILRASKTVNLVSHTCHRWARSVNHCSLHGGLMKFHGLMYQGKYRAVIGKRKLVAWK